MIDTTSRRDRRSALARSRLDRLVRQVRPDLADRPASPPADPAWFDPAPAPDGRHPLLDAAPWPPPAGPRPPGSRAAPPPHELLPADDLNYHTAAADDVPSPGAALAERRFTGRERPDPPPPFSPPLPPEPVVARRRGDGSRPAPAGGTDTWFDATAEGDRAIPNLPPGPPPDLPPGLGPARPWWRRGAGRLLERWAPADGSGGPRWRVAALAAAGAVLGIAVAVGLVVSAAPRTAETPETAPALPVASASAVGRTAGGAPSTAGGSMVVSVVGKVAAPGLVTLPEGSRVADALEAAGGPVRGAQLGGLNLARRLADGEQIYVGVPVPAGADPGSGASGPGGQGGAPGGGSAGAGPVDLNSASLGTLDTLPGVGPVTAQRIVDWRTQHGRFTSVEQLREIEGIGPTRFARLKELVVAW